MAIVTTTRPEQITEERASELRERIAAVLSDIFSDRYECKVTLHFESSKN